jgi:ABC-type dipeptide/oligopeptide/nickel transport system ATPase subunit
LVGATGEVGGEIMARVIAVAGESGSGKTTSLRNLDPSTTFIIDADRKGLSWRGWKSQYNKENKNYSATSNIPFISQTLKAINDKALNIKVVVIDTINSIMVDDEMDRMKEKGFDKWADMAASVWGLVSNSHLLRDDLTVIFMAHTQTDRDDTGYMFTRIKTSGRKLDKLTLESKFTTVLLAKCVDGKHVFETKARNSTAKSPMGAFQEFEIENDIAKVIKELEEF